VPPTDTPVPPPPTATEVDPTLDTDGDGMPDILENRVGTLPNNPNTDGDDCNDGREYFDQNPKTNPLVNDCFIID
jgi:hypothetical protein